MCHKSAKTNSLTLIQTHSLSWTILFLAEIFFFNGARVARCGSTPWLQLVKMGTISLTKALSCRQAVYDGIVPLHSVYSDSWATTRHFSAPHHLHLPSPFIRAAVNQRRSTRILQCFVPLPPPAEIYLYRCPHYEGRMDPPFSPSLSALPWHPTAF